MEGALIAIENRTGEVLAMVGGYDFDRSRFNRATQAFRQLGSLFKGVLYAAAVDQGHTTTSILRDEPVSFEVGPGQPRVPSEQLRLRVQGTSHPSPRSGDVTQRAGGVAHERSRPRSGRRLRAPRRLQLAESRRTCPSLSARPRQR